MTRPPALSGVSVTRSGQQVLDTVGRVSRFPLLLEGQARAHVKRALEELRYPYQVVPFSHTLRIPVAWQVQVQGSAPGSRWTTLPSAAALGSPPCREVAGPVVPVGGGAPEEFRLGGQGCRGSIVLAALGTTAPREIIRVAHERGALGVLLFHPRAPSVRAVAPAPRLSVPAATIGREAAKALIRAGARARLEVESEEREHSFENIFVRRGDGPLHVVVTGHYDARPLHLGPGGRSLGVAVMVSLLAMLRVPVERRITFAFLDGEEFGSVGSAQYYEDVRAEALEPPDLVVDLDALGTRRELGVGGQDAPGGSGRLQAFALQALEIAGLHATPREVDQLYYGGAPRPYLGWPVVALGGRPRPRIPCGDSEQGIPDRWGVSRLVGPLARILCEARP